MDDPISIYDLLNFGRLGDVMQFALVEKLRSPATPGGQGECPMCGGRMIAKCGPQIMHHWAHVSKQCDPWWENETEWHRSWKEKFPEDYREVNHIDKNGEIHRADIKHPSGLVVEVQHSSMSIKERDSREKFYGKMVWIVDARSFFKQIHICHPLPSPDSDLVKDVRFFPASPGMLGANGGLFYRVSEQVKDSIMVRVRPFHEIEDEVRSTYVGHRQYYWIRPREVWLTSSVPVFLDNGERWLYRLMNYGPQGLPCIRYYPKKLFLNALLDGLIPPD